MRRNLTEKSGSQLMDFDEEQQIDPDVLAGKKPLFTTINKQQEDLKVTRISDTGPRDQEQSENFEWIKVIGQGTFGVVYKVQEKSNGNIYAIKKVFQDPKYSNREFKIVVELNHPNCIKVH